MSVVRSRRFRLPLAIAWGASVTGVGLAVAPWFFGPSNYDPGVAVLTATLVAVIWYTYFTYKAVHREEPTWISLELASNSGSLLAEISNPTARTVDVHPKLEVWIGGEVVNVSPLHWGKHGEWIRLGPHETFVGSSNVLKKKPDGSSDRSALVRITVAWTDDLGDEYETDPKHWRYHWPANDLRPLVASSLIEKHFAGLPPHPAAEKRSHAGSR
jgi:hypothetical protein